MPEKPEKIDALIIGAGPAGLMAAEAISASGATVLVAEAKPSPARKFLMAGKSGLNLTKKEAPGTFLQAYGKSAKFLAPMLDAFGPDDVQIWARGLGADLFTGSTGRVFPREMKASPLLRAWLFRLYEQGVTLRRSWRWTGWEGAACRFDTAKGPRLIAPDVTVLALGGASWPRLGSDGAWTAALAAEGVALSPFAPSNAGIAIRWSDHMTRHFGTPLKALAMAAGGLTSRGECVISSRGLEGGGVYGLTPAIRGGAALTLDLKPDLTETEVAARLEAPRGKASLRDHLRRRLRLAPAAIALLQECARPLPEGAELARRIKSLAVPHQGAQPIATAISTAGGVGWDALDDALMFRVRRGTYCVGEMIDWEAPTGGYLLSACLATGLWAGRAAAAQLGAKTR